MYMRKIICILILGLVLFCSCGSRVSPELDELSGTATETESISADSVSEQEEAPDPAPTQEEFAALRAKIPYGGVTYCGSGLRPELPVFLDSSDEVGKKIALYTIVLGIGEQEIATYRDLGNSKIIGTAVVAITPYASEPDFNDFPYLPELDPIGKRVRETSSYLFWLQEHVEQSVKELYGEDVVVEHQRGEYDFQYNEALGVYYKPPRGGVAEPSAVIFEYEDLGDAYRAEVAYVQLNIGTYQNMATGEKIADYDDKNIEAILVDYLQNHANRYHLYFKKQGNSIRFDKQVLAR